MAQEATISSPHWYLWDGGFFAIGRNQGLVPPHAHHAVQITLAVEGTIRITDASGVWRTCRGAIVRADATHSLDGGDGVVGAMLFVDPESAEGVWLQTSLHADVTMVPDARMDQCVPALRAFIDRPLEAMDVRDLIQHCVRALCAGAPPARKLDPRIAGVLAAIRASDDLRISVADAADMVFLSPSRFAHLFTEHVGLPFRRYMLWRKLTRAMLSFGRGHNLTAAAHAAGFSDAAHLTRTFLQMLGIPPSVMMRGEFFEVTPPFELASST